MNSKRRLSSSVRCCPVVCGEPARQVGERIGRVGDD